MTFMFRMPLDFMLRRYLRCRF